MERSDDIRADTIEEVMERLELSQDREMNLKVCVNEIICMANMLTNLCSAGEVLPSVDVFEGVLERLCKAALYPTHLNLRHKANMAIHLNTSNKVNLDSNNNSY